MRLLFRLSLLLLFIPPVYAQQDQMLNLHYIQIDSTKQMWGDWAEPEWLRYFGLDIGDVNRDGNLDILSGRYLYHNPGGNMEEVWKRTVLDDNVDGILLIDVDKDAHADIIAMALPDLFWYEAIDKAGSRYTRTKIGQIPATSHINSQGFEKAQLLSDGLSEFVIAGNGDIYGVAIPEENADSAVWKINMICRDTSDEGIGIGDIDGDGDLDIAAGRRAKGEDEPKVLMWFQNPGNMDTLWKEYAVGESMHPIDRVKVADIDGDGQGDIIVTEERYPGLEPDANLWWYRQLPAGKWLRNAIATQYSTNNLDISDIDLDGDIDILAAEHKGEALELQLWYNDGKGNFTKTVLDTGKENHLGTKWADLDNDGDLDIVGAGWDKHQYLHVWRNNKSKPVKTGMYLEKAADSSSGESKIEIVEGIYQGRPHYLIYSKATTYYLDIFGGGLSRIIDNYGNDWIGFKNEPWDKYPESAASSYRGIPNLVFLGDDSGAGHPGHNKCISEITSANSITTKSKSGLWEWEWTFFEDHVVLDIVTTDTKVPYWFLYEGTPGGSYKPESLSYGTDVLGLVKDTPDFYKKDIKIGNFQWAYFNKEDVNKTLFIASLAKDDKTDIMSYLGNSKDGVPSKDGMTVFGFGRDANNSPLLKGSNTFIIGIYDKIISNSADYEKITKHIQKKINETKK